MIKRFFFDGIGVNGRNPSISFGNKYTVNGAADIACAGVSIRNYALMRT